MTILKYPVVTPPKIIATTGWTTDDLVSAISRSGITDKKFDFVTLLIGVNDQYQQQSQDNYRITRNLTLNLGLRWELNSFFEGIRGQTNAFDFDWPWI